MWRIPANTCVFAPVISQASPTLDAVVLPWLKFDINASQAFKVPQASMSPECSSVAVTKVSEPVPFWTRLGRSHVSA